MFDRHYHIQDERSRVEAARINAMSQEKFAKQLKDISEAEIKSKDRVDITLEEYERLKSENKLLTERVRTLMSVIERLNIPTEILEYILPDSVKIYTCHDIDFMNERQRYRIEFSVPREYLKGL